MMRVADILLVLIFAACFLTGVSAALRADDFMLNVPEESGSGTGDESEEAARTDLALQYLNRCMEMIYTSMEPETRESYCGCTAEQIRDKFSLEEMKTMATGAGAKVSDEKLLMEVQAPCIVYPMRELEYKTCKVNESTHYYQSQELFEAMCLCMSRNGTSMLETNGRDFMAALVEKSGIPVNPLESVRANRDYNAEIRRWRSTCRGKYAYQ